MQGIAAKSHPDLGLLRECRVRLKHEAVPSRQLPSFACVLLRLLAWVASPACLLKKEDDRSGQGGQNYCCDETSFRKEIGAVFHCSARSSRSDRLEATRAGSWRFPMVGASGWIRNFVLL